MLAIALIATAFASPTAFDRVDVDAHDAGDAALTLTVTELARPSGATGLAVAVEGGTPLGALAILGGAGIGGEYLTLGPCVDVFVPIDGPAPVTDTPTVSTDEAGTWAAFVYDRASRDVGTLAVVDLETCAVSNLVVR
jgi:hypothetical protein